MSGKPLEFSDQLIPAGDSCECGECGAMSSASHYTRRDAKGSLIEVWIACSKCGMRHKLPEDDAIDFIGG